MPSAMVGAVSGSIQAAARAPKRTTVTPMLPISVKRGAPARRACRRRPDEDAERPEEPEQTERTEEVERKRRNEFETVRSDVGVAIVRHEEPHREVDGEPEPDRPVGQRDERATFDDQVRGQDGGAEERDFVDEAEGDDPSGGVTVEIDVVVVDQRSDVGQLPSHAHDRGRVTHSGACRAGRCRRSHAAEAVHYAAARRSEGGNHADWNTRGGARRRRPARDRCRAARHRRPVAPSPLRSERPPSRGLAPRGDRPVRGPTRRPGGVAPSVGPPAGRFGSGLDMGHRRDGRLRRRPRPRAPDALPGDHHRRSGRWNVHFRSRLDVGLGAVADAVGELESLVGRSDSLVVRFPGADQALTGLRATSRPGAGGLTWHSWHCYPGADPHVVRTTTVVTPTAGDPVDPTDRRPHPTERDRRP